MTSGAKPAVQSRSQQTRDRLLAAMDTLLQEKPFEAISIAEIAERAGVSAATIYQRFANKDAAIAILIELYMRKVEAWSRSKAGRIDAAAASSLREALVMVGVTAWRQFEALRYVMRPAYLYSRLRPDLTGEYWAALERQALAGFERLLAAFPTELEGRDLHPTASLVVYFYNMMFLGRLLHGERDAWAPPEDERGFAEALADFVCGYLAVAPKVSARPSGRRKEKAAVRGGHRRAKGAS